MYEHILIATDGSAIASKAVSQGASLAKRLGAKVTIVAVSEPFAGSAPPEVAIVFPFEAYEKATEENAAKVLSRAREIVESHGTTCDVVHVKQQHPADGILEIAASRSCDLIVMGSHGYRGVTRFLLGSQADRVVTGSHVSVLICR